MADFVQQIRKFLCIDCERFCSTGQVRAPLRCYWWIAYYSLHSCRLFSFFFISDSNRFALGDSFEFMVEPRQYPTLMALFTIVPYLLLQVSVLFLLMFRKDMIISLAKFFLFLTSHPSGNHLQISDLRLKRLVKLIPLLRNMILITQYAVTLQ